MSRSDHARGGTGISNWSASREISGQATGDNSRPAALFNGKRLAGVRILCPCFCPPLLDRSLASVGAPYVRHYAVGGETPGNGLAVAPVGSKIGDDRLGESSGSCQLCLLVRGAKLAVSC